MGCYHAEANNSEQSKTGAGLVRLDPGGTLVALAYNNA